MKNAFHIAKHYEVLSASFKHIHRLHRCNFITSCYFLCVSYFLSFTDLSFRICENQMMISRNYRNTFMCLVLNIICVYYCNILMHNH